MLRAAESQPQSADAAVLRGPDKDYTVVPTQRHRYYYADLLCAAADKTDMDQASRPQLEVKAWWRSIAVVVFETVLRHF